MNVFAQYGIREVADVTFYSITRIGDEEFYIPVLYFDTLKVTTVDKTVSTVSSNAGVGNGKIMSWNFNKDLKLKLEDALFSQMSLDVFMNGRVMARMSDWTSAIAKLTVANKYGQKHYSTKAYASPELTDDEWEIVYRCAQKAGFDPRTGYTDEIGYNRLGKENHTCKYLFDSEEEDESIDTMVAENRWLLKDNYYKRTQKTPHSRDLSMYFDFNTKDFESVSIVMKDQDLKTELEQAKRVHNMVYGQKWGGWRDLVVTYRRKEEDYELDIKDGSTDIQQAIIQINFCIQKKPQGYYCEYAYISADNMEEGKTEDEVTINILDSLFTGYNKTKDTTSGSGGNFNSTYHIGNEFFLSHILYYIFPNYLEDAIGDLCWCDLNEKTYKAMPLKVIDYIMDEITDFEKTGNFENDLYEINVVDTFEKCVVKDPRGLKIDLVEQMKNVKKFYSNEYDTFTVFYDYKTMMPFMEKRVLDDKILSQKCVRIQKDDYLTQEDYLAAIKSYFRGQYDDEWIDSLTYGDYIINKVVDRYNNVFDSDFEIIEQGDTPYNQQGEVLYDGELDCYLVYFTILKHEYIYLKYGTVYYKRRRTVDEDENDITYLGTNLSIDVDTFPGEYMITGLTTIRSQKTGKDEDCQIVINRATLSSGTKISLTASGAPTTFSIDVNALMPYDTKNKSMVELKMYKSEEDTVEGGTRIVPQKKRYVRTQTAEIVEQVVGKNEEIY